MDDLSDIADDKIPEKVSAGIFPTQRARIVLLPNRTPVINHLDNLLQLLRRKLLAIPAIRLSVDRVTEDTCGFGDLDVLLFELRRDGMAEAVERQPFPGNTALLPISSEPF